MIQQNKKAFSTGDFVVAMLIFSGVIALLVLSAGSMANEYENPNVINEEFSSRFDDFENETLKTKEMWNAATSEEGSKLVGTVEVLFFSTFKVISLIFSSVIEAGNQLFSLGEFIGIPSRVSAILFTLIITTLTIIIIFRVLNSVKGTKGL